MKVKLAGFAIVLICAVCVLFAGLLSVYRSEGRDLSEEIQSRIQSCIAQLDDEK